MAACAPRSSHAGSYNRNSNDDLVPGNDLAPLGGVDENTNHNTRDDTSHWQGDDPAEVDPGDHAPVDGPPGTRAETDTDGGTGDTLGSGDGETETRSHEHSEGRAQHHGETMRWRVQGDAVTELAHHVVAVEPETDRDSGTTVCESPDGHGGLSGHLVGGPDEVDGGERADSAGVY